MKSCRPRMVATPKSHQPSTSNKRRPGDKAWPNVLEPPEMAGGSCFLAVERVGVVEFARCEYT